MNDKGAIGNKTRKKQDMKKVSCCLCTKKLL